MPCVCTILSFAEFPQFHGIRVGLENHFCSPAKPPPTGSSYICWECVLSLCCPPSFLAFPWSPLSETRGLTIATACYYKNCLVTIKKLLYLCHFSTYPMFCWPCSLSSECDGSLEWQSVAYWHINTRSVVTVWSSRRAGCGHSVKGQCEY